MIHGTDVLALTSDADASSIVSQGLGRPLIGFYSDKVGRINVAALCTLTAGIAAFFLWIFAGQHYPGAIIYALFGAFAGCIWPCIAPVAVEVIGLQLLPSGTYRASPLAPNPPTSRMRMGALVH